MSSGNVRRRKNKSSARKTQSANSSNTSSTAHTPRLNGPSSRAKSPVATAATTGTTDTANSAGFATGEDYIAFEFSDNEEQESDTSVVHSHGKGKGKERAHRNGRDPATSLKRTATQMEDGRYTNKKQRMDAASRLTPWAGDVDWESCRNLAEMTHKEVKAFINYISPRPEEHEVRSMVIATIAHAVRNSWPDAEILPFGSFETKLYLPLGDIDLVIHSTSMERHKKRRILTNLAHILRNADITDNVTVIPKAKVPIIKFVTTQGRFSVDISVNQDNGIASGRIVNRFLQEFPSLRALIMVIKLFLSQRGMNEVYQGGLGSYAIVCMAVSFLQMHPKVRSGEIDPSENLGVLVMEFFELYGHYFNYENTGISIRDGGTYFNKMERGWLDPRQISLLSIEDPNDISNDIAKNSYNISSVRKTLAGAHEILTTSALMRARILTSKTQGYYTQLHPLDSRYEYENRSILGSVMGVTQETLNHRRMVRQLYEQNTLQAQLGLAPYEALPIAIDRQAPGHSYAVSTISSIRAVESAWGEAEMDISESEVNRAMECTPEAEESRYSIGHARKRRRLQTEGEEDRSVSRNSRREYWASKAWDGQAEEGDLTRRKYWASKAGDGIEEAQ